MFKFFFRYFHDIEIAIESIVSNKLKSMLTALGIIFGVAAVIAMLAIGRGAKQEIMDQMKMVGVNNILINPIIQEASTSGSEDSEKQTKKFSRGLSMLDVEAIYETLPSVKRISPEISFNSVAMMNGVKYTAKLVGVSNDYFHLYNLPLVHGTFFNEYQEKNGIQVCIIGANIRAKFFSKVDPLGQYIKFNGIWLKVIGVLQKTNVSLTGFEEKGVNVYNDNIYIPIQTMLLRFQNRALVNTKLVSEASSNMMIMGGGGPGGMGRVIISGSDASNAETNYNQLDRIVVQVNETEQLNPSTEILSRMLTRGNREHLAPGGWYWYNEHYVCLGYGEDKGDWHQDGDRCQEDGHCGSVPRGGCSDKCYRWLHRYIPGSHHGQTHRTGCRYYDHCILFFNIYRFRSISCSGCYFRIPPGQECIRERSHRIIKIRIKHER